MNAVRFIALASILVVVPGASAQTDEADAYGDGYQAGDYGRVRYADGGALVVRASSQDNREERAGANTPLFPGDSLRTASGERVEIELSLGTFVRVDRDSSVTFQSMPSPYAKYRDNTVLNLDQGTLRIAARVEQDDEFRIDTPSGSVYLLGDGDFRIDATADQTRVESRRGVAEVVGEGGSVLVRGGMRTNAYRGIIPEDPRAFTSYASDPFDRWVAAREDAYRGHEAVPDDGQVADLPDEVQPYYQELSSYGSWTVVPEYGQVWYPSSVPAGWRPYGDGYWNYGPSGYFWVGNEPWGWAPYRYGRWNWVGGYGWCWSPGSVYAGAWVSWSWGSAYYGWAPLDYWGYPAHYGSHLYYGYYDPGCWTFVDHHHLGHHDVHRNAVPVDRVPREELERNRVVGRAPSVPPRRLAESSEWRDRASRAAAGEPSLRRRPAEGGERAAAARGFRDVENRMTRRTAADFDRRETPARAERARGPERENPGRTVEGPRFPRRVTEDPRVREETRRGNGPRRETAAPAPQAPRDSRPVDRERRSLYDRVSRPRDVQDGDTRRESPRPAPRGTPQRDEPRREQAPPPRQAPQRQELRREQAPPPRQAPPRQAPQRQAPQRQDLRRDESRREQAAPPRQAPQRQELRRPQAPPQRPQPQPRVEPPRPQPRREQAQPSRPAPRPEARRESAKPKKDDGGGGGRGKRGGR